MLGGTILLTTLLTLSRSMQESKKDQRAHIVSTVVDELEDQVEGTVEGVDRMMRPIRTSAFRKFPTLFTLLSAAGLVSTFLGIEKILEQYQVLNDYPWLLFIGGVAMLVFTGTLYKKLG